MSRRTTVLIWLVDHMMWGVLAILFAANALFTPSFLTYGNVVNILFHSCILAILVLALGLTLMTGNFDLSIESTMAFAPGIAALLMTSWVPGFPPGMALIVTLLIGVLVGLFNGVCITALSINPFLQTLSILIILRGFTLYLIPLSVYGLPSAYTFLGRVRTIGNIPVAVLFTIVMFAVFHFILEKTIFGRSILATGGNRDASYARGINTSRIVTITFAVSGLLGAVAGLLATGRQGAVTNIMGQGMVFEAFAGAVLGGVSLQGGRGSITGMIVGVLILGVINNSLILLGVSPYLVYALKGALIFGAILVDRNRTRLRNALYYGEEMRRVARGESSDNGRVVLQAESGVLDRAGVGEAKGSTEPPSGRLF